MKTGFGWIGLLALLAGCGATQPGATETPDKLSEEVPPDLKADPIHLRATRDKERLAIEAYDATGLFNQAAKKLRQGQCDQAIEMYRQLVDEFPTSRFAAPSLYNSGLCGEQLKQFHAAAGDYLNLIRTYPDARDITDALFRLGGTYEQLEAWEDARETFDILLAQRTDLEGIERIEAMVRKGASLMQLSRRREAKLILEEAALIFRAGRDIPPSTSTYYLGMAQFKIGEIVQFDMSEAPLPADETLIQAALEHKCQLLLDAQQAYTKAIKVAHPHWAAAAAYRIGNLYHRLWDDMVTAPAPTDLNNEERDVYAEVLKNRIHVLLTKAVRQWERTLKMARRLNLSNDWITQTEAELVEVRAKLASGNPPLNTTR
jgi:tetratricopeptide (TPR) repeat protein